MNDIMTVRLHEVGKVSAVVKDAVVVEKDVPGVGVPPGGASGQVLTKLSGADYDTGWRAAIGGGENDHSKLTNRDAKDQHPMGAIAGLAEALDGKQPKGDYLTADKLQSATDAALAQAKASGVFDGVPGKDAATDISLGITGATIGQIAKITAVDSDGKPTAWAPVDMPTGGGETWELIASGVMAETAKLTINKDNSGLPFSLKSAQIFIRGDLSITKGTCMSVSAKRYASSKDYDSYSVEAFFNEENPKVNLFYVLQQKMMPMLYWETHGTHWQSADCKVLMGVHRHYTVEENTYGKDQLDHQINEVAIGAVMGGGNMAAGCKWEIWGVRA